MVPPTISASLASIPGAIGRTRTAKVRTLLVVGGAPVVAAGMATVFVEWQPPVVLGSVEFAVACVAFHLGLVHPDSGPRYSADDLTFFGGLVAAASPFLLFALVTLLPASSFVFARSDFVLPAGRWCYSARTSDTGSC
ncbi:hypothetical protein [Haladaptatus halobius]|uniref:hypothetical protein n=1 Tax=Haladaptatus halobius TaxID=2884875 RepID=UPI001D0A7897|nr:hypothetical protein [Haladaptatus halobius]